MSDCLFCKILSGDIPADKVYENDAVFAFRDVSPQAPTHILVIPKKHITSLNHLQSEDAGIMGELFMAAKKISEDENIAEAGYRTVVNCNAAGGQSVFHIHLHLLGGRNMSWPPG